MRDDARVEGERDQAAGGSGTERIVEPTRAPGRDTKDGTTAWEAPGTQESYAAYRLGALRWLGGGVAGIALAIGLSVYAVTVLKRPGLGVFIVGAVILGLIGIGAGAGGLLRARRLRKGLQQAPWRRAELRVAGAHLRLVFPAAKSGPDGDQTEEDAHTVDLRLMTTSRWRVREVVGFRDGEVLVCPLRDGDFVLTAHGLNNLYGLRPLARKKGP